MDVKCPKKLIEVALPLDVINVASVRENYIYRGNPSALHKWWAQRPLAAARAVLFAQLVNDPGYEQGAGFKRGVNKERAAIERDRLFGIIERLVIWENMNDEDVLAEAREEIWKSWRETCQLNRAHPLSSVLFDPNRLPAFHDPFAGAGTIPLEAQRLGLEAYASDLNPVAVLINKAVMEIPQRFTDTVPVGPRSKGQHQSQLHEDWSGTKGLAEDVRRYGAWMRDEAEKLIGHFYPKVKVTAEMAKGRPDLKPLVGQQRTVIAWLWARTVKSPNPAFSHVNVPLASTFMLSTKAGKEAYVEPVIEGDCYRFKIKLGLPSAAAKTGTKVPGKGSSFYCLLSKSPIDGRYIKSEAQGGRLGARLLAIVIEGVRGRVYLEPSAEQETMAAKAVPAWRPEQELVGKARDQVPLYGMNNYSELFTARQLVALTTFTDLLQQVRARVVHDARAANWPEDSTGLSVGGVGARAYSEGISVYLSFAIDKVAEYGCTLVPWYTKEDRPKGVFARQAVPMVWDFAEVNPLCDIGGSFVTSSEVVAGALDGCSTASGGVACQANATEQNLSLHRVISTDPPYYNNICYADLSDFLYVWLRRSLKSIFPDLCATLASPKAGELIATPYRHDTKEQAEMFFLDGMTQAMRRLAEQAHPSFPVTIYYAFKQSDNEAGENGGTGNTGWDTFLEAVIRAGFSITGTWPMRTERGARSIGLNSNALASSIVLVCRQRVPNAPLISRREFIRELNEVLPFALDDMTRGGVNSPLAPVDLSQAIIGPGMAIYSKYSAVLEADGSRMSVRTALQLINRFLAEDDFDHDTQFCLHWFENWGWAEGKFGEADVLARAKGTSVEGVKTAGVLASAKGVVRLLRWAEYPMDWDPTTDQRTPVWEALHHLIRALNQKSAVDAGRLLARMPAKAESIRQLAYRLYTLCERKGWAEDARAYNELITSWSSIETASHEVGHVGGQTELDV